MDKGRIASEVQSYPHSRQESRYPHIHGQDHNWADLPQSYELTHSTIPEEKTNTSEYIVPVPHFQQPQAQVVRIDYTQREPDFNDYFCACCFPPCFVAQKKGCCGIDCWFNILIGVICGPFNIFHACLIAREPYPRQYATPQPVVVEEPGQIQSSNDVDMATTGYHILPVSVKE